MMLLESYVPRILIVDDEPDMIWALRIALKSDGYDVTSAATAAEVLDLLVQERFDVAFVDAVLSDWDGTELAALIHELQPRTAIILVSGYYYAEDLAIIEGLQTGLYLGFVAKPFDLNAVCSLIRKAVNQNAEV